MEKTDWKYCFDFLMAMTKKEIVARYKKAVFGFLWVVINPMLQMLVIGIIFSFFIQIPHYFLFLFPGLLVWGFFSQSVAVATSSIVNARPLLQKAKFPIFVVPVSIVLSNFFNLIIALLLVLLFIAITGELVLQGLFWIAIALLWILVFTIGFVLLTSSCEVRYRDVSFLIQSLLLVWFYASPILYSMKLLPGYLRSWFVFNPLTTIFELIHQSVVGKSEIEPVIVLVNILITCLIVWLGVTVYRREKGCFVDWI